MHRFVFLIPLKISWRYSKAGISSYFLSPIHSKTHVTSTRSHNANIQAFNGPQNVFKRIVMGPMLCCSCCFPLVMNKFIQTHMCHVRRKKVLAKIQASLATIVPNIKTGLDQLACPIPPAINQHQYRIHNGNMHC